MILEKHLPRRSGASADLQPCCRCLFASADFLPQRICKSDAWFYY